MNIDRYEAAKKMFLAGILPSKIAKEVSIPLSTFLYKLEKEGLYERKRNAVFSTEQIKKINLLRVKGYAAKRIARELNLPVSRLLEYLREELSDTITIKETNRDRSKRVRHLLNVHYFDEIDTEDRAYWLGFLFADGSLQKQRLTVKLSSKDKDHLNLLVKAIEYTGQIEDIKKDTNYKKGASFSILQLNSSELARTLNKYIPYGKKSDKIEFPSWLDKDLIWHFVRGYFDGDGYFISTRKQIGFCGNPNFLKKLKEMFCDFGIATERDGHFQNQTENYAELVFGIKVSSNIVRMMYENANVSLKRKRMIIHKP